MRLKCIKLAGFKSFVDPTTVEFPSNLCAVVGPNGCGKSNIIDAVRWVMGESSAKNLRGESMTDVIFNGSSGRKPVGQASIELVFDNSDHSLLGEYAAYNEISIKRRVGREGDNQYFLNGQKCRRKDITDIFLGTGLGPRSYAIIEQGMISKLIEAKPDELRVYIEEAAGISKYKERRRETESRMRRTQENLERLADIREELERQLQHLYRQAQAAERYTELKAQERQKKAELQAIQWRVMQESAEQFQVQISDYECELEAALTKQVNLELQAEKLFVGSQQSRGAFEAIQSSYYSIAADIARCEQALSFHQKQQKKQQQELQVARQQYQQSRQLMQADKDRQQQWQRELESVNPELELLFEQEENSQVQLLGLEEQADLLQQQWEEFTRTSAQSQQQAELQRSRIQDSENALLRIIERKKRLQQEQEIISLEELEEDIVILSEQLAESELELEREQESLDALQLQIEQARKKHRELDDALDELKARQHSEQGRLSSLQELQQAALDTSNDDVLRWLMRQDLADNALLAEVLSVKPGWERAVETVLFGQLQAVLVDDVEPYAEQVVSLKSGSMCLLSQQLAKYDYRSFAASLVSKVEGDYLDGMLAGIYVADTVEQALTLRAHLAANESIVCADGTWLGRNWLRSLQDEDAQAGILKRKVQIEQLEQSLQTLQERRDALEQQEQVNSQALDSLENQRNISQQQLKQHSTQFAQGQLRLTQQQTKLEQLVQRKKELNRDEQEFELQYQQEHESLQEARQLLQEAMIKVEQQSQYRNELEALREAHRRDWEQAKLTARWDKDRAHQLAMQEQALRTQLLAINESLQRSEAQQALLYQRISHLEDAINNQIQPNDEVQYELELLLDKRIILETDLAKAREQVESFEAARRDNERQRTQVQQQLDKHRLHLEQARLASQTITVQKDTLLGQIEASEFVLESLLAILPTIADEKTWQDALQLLAQKIQRLGAINLAAIEEYQAASERKLYLDQQNEDLEEALATLEGAIRRIDRETRARFKETFEQVNQGIQDLFPKVFGGGRAYLALTGEDLLDTGVAIMAQPPGKRNSTIHLLSGGEKALTAIALVFSIFRLNPAPFCMLDEVDAPLDDANVGRYAKMVEEMSAHVQFIYITHNKIAMEMAQQLLGVTMHEPGVSRIVTVDVEAAAELAAS